MSSEKSIEKKSPFVKGQVENSGGHRAWNRNPKAKFNKGTNSMSKQVMSRNRKKV